MTTTANAEHTVYDKFSVILHWLTVLLVVSQFVLAQTWEWFARPTHHLMVVAHMSLGIILFAVILLRLVWRLMPGHHVVPAGSGWISTASRLVHYSLYAMLVVEGLLGFVLRWAGDESMSFFGLLLPPPFAPFSKPAHHLVGELHELTGWAIIIVATGHAAAALYHHYVVRDQVMSRMVPSIREQ